MIAESNNQIGFYYPYSELFSKIELKSTYGAKSMPPTVLGEDAVDAYGLTQSEEPYMRVAIEGALHKLFELFVREARSVEDSLFVSHTIEDTECCGFSVEGQMINEKLTYNTNRAKSVDSACEEYLVNSVLLGWSKTNRLPDDMAIYAIEVEQSMARVKRENFELKKRSYAESFKVSEVSDIREA